jgi:hypothetical protein
MIDMALFKTKIRKPTDILANYKNRFEGGKAHPPAMKPVIPRPYASMWKDTLICRQLFPKRIKIPKIST